MTTGQTISASDLGDFPQFDDGGVDDGGGGVRVSIAAVRGEGAFDGGWWPRSFRLADELPGLVTALSTADEPIARVSVNGDTWTDIPARLAHPDADRPALRVSWFRTIDAHTITLRSGFRPPVRLLVIPPDTAAGPASDLLRSAAAAG